MAAERLVLAYRREGNDSTGHLSLVGEEEKKLAAFERETFPSMLNHLARAIAAHPELPVVFQRIDHPHLQPFVLDPATVELFRVDPVAAIHSMTFEAPVLPPRAPRTPVPTLRAGFDTLAEAFGETIYLKLQKGGVECPGCGHWGMLVKATNDAPHGLLRCRYCPPYVPVIALRVGERWASIATPALLLLPLSKFYLPLAWNEGGWITRQDLDDKYKAFMAEKETTCSSKPLLPARSGS